MPGQNYLSFVSVDFLITSLSVASILLCRHYLYIHQGPFFLYGITLISAWINNHKPSKIWDQITYLFPKCNAYTIEICEWISNFATHFTYVWCNYWSRPRQNGHHFPDDVFKCIFLNENISISIKILLRFVPRGPINNIPALVQTMAWRRQGDKPLSEPMMVSLPTHICVTRPQWVKVKPCHQKENLGICRMTEFRSRNMN